VAENPERAEWRDHEEGELCTRCDGKGEVSETIKWIYSVGCGLSDMDYCTTIRTCPRCEGSGRVLEPDCECRCNPCQCDSLADERGA
jgi:hypothetical protein